MNNSNEETTCDICFTTKPLLVTPCQHRACQDCFEHLLLSTSDAPVETPQQNRNCQEFLEDCIVAACPTRGKCPFCRSYLNLFELVTDKSENNTERYNTQGEGERKTGKLHEIRIEESPLAGMVFVDMKKHVGEFSYHFPSSNSSKTAGDSDDNNKRDSIEKIDDDDNDDVIETAKGETELMPWMNLANIVEDNKLDNGSPLPNQKFFDHGFNYHEKSRTFTGKIDWTKGQDGSTFNRSHYWEVIMQFTLDFRHISQGAVIKHYNTTLSIEQQALTPLDGSWCCQWEHTRSDRGEIDARDSVTTMLRVIGNSFQLYGIRYAVHMPTNGDMPYFNWPGFGNCVQTVESGIDFVRKKDGPEVGEIIVWTVDHPDYHRIRWTRASKGDAPPMIIERFGPRGSLKYGRYSKSCGQLIPKYRKNSIWGNTFVQSLRVGYASYHFISADGEGHNGVYISYEHPDCGGWPPLDDGSPVPFRVPFVEFSFDEETRTFRGKVAWKDTYGASWNGSARWTYEMVFDSEYTCIISGKVESLSNSGSTKPPHYYGEVLNYFNAAIEEKIGDELNHLHENGMNENEARNNNNDNSSELYRLLQVSRVLVGRLEEEGAETRTIMDIQKVLRGDSVDRS